MTKLSACLGKTATWGAGCVWRGIAVCALATITAICAGSAAWALPSCPVSPSTISACCVADQPGQFYELGADITATGECFDISAPNVLFEQDGHTITGPVGAGIGVHVLSTAPNAIVAGAGEIEKFATGFVSDAPNTFVLEVISEENNRGIVFNGPGAFGLEAISGLNLGNGIVFTSAASGSYILVPVSVENSGNGIVLNGTTGVNLLGAESFENVGYGIWFKGASFNTLSGGDLEGNTIAGAYVGCHKGGPSSAACSIPPSNGNTLTVDGGSTGLVVGSCPEGTLHNQAYGIAIDVGNVKNHVAGVETDTNTKCSPPGDTLFDGYDGNPGAGCAGNFWYADNFTIKPNHTPSTTHPLCMD